MRFILAFAYDRLVSENRLVSHLYHCPFDMTRIEGETCLQALNGFIFIMSCDGEIFSVSKTVEHYLGFHQADILHQSVLELIHSEDREEFIRKLSWRNELPPELQSCTLSELMTRELCHHLRRRFTVRFRCLLDNTSGFITLELCGRLQFLYGQLRGKHSTSCVPSSQLGHAHINSARSMVNSASPSGHKTNTVQYGQPPLGLFVVCSPLGPMPSLMGAQRDLTFKTKHQLDLTVMSIDSRTRTLFNYTDTELQRVKVYDLVHPDDLLYVAQGHREVFRTGSIGLLVHRWLNKSGLWIWLQSRVKLMLKNGKHDHIIAIHRQLSYQEGMELFIRRSEEYKLPFPFLEPETLLSEESLPGSGQLADHSGIFSTPQVKEFEPGFMGSLVNGSGSSSLTTVDSVVPFSSHTMINENSSLDTGNTYGRGLKLDAYSNVARHRLTVDRRPLTSDVLMTSRFTQSTVHPFSSQMNPAQAITSRNRGTGKSTHCRRKRNLNKSSFQPECATVSCGQTIYSGTPHVYHSFGQPHYAHTNFGDQYPRNDTAHCETNKRSGRWLGLQPAHAPDPGYISNFFGWETSDVQQRVSFPHAFYSEQSFPEMLMKNYPMVGDFSTRGHEIATQANAENYNAYSTPYDAYAMAAAAMVAAASSCQNQAPQLTASRVDPGLHRVRADRSDMLGYSDYPFSRLYATDVHFHSEAHSTDTELTFHRQQGNQPKLGTQDLSRVTESASHGESDSYRSFGVNQSVDNKTATSIFPLYSAKAPDPMGDICQRSPTLQRIYQAPIFDVGDKVAQSQLIHLQSQAIDAALGFSGISNTVFPPQEHQCSTATNTNQNLNPLTFMPTPSSPVSNNPQHFDLISSPYTLLKETVVNTVCSKRSGFHSQRSMESPHDRLKPADGLWHEQSEARNAETFFRSERSKENQDYVDHVEDKLPSDNRSTSSLCSSSTSRSHSPESGPYSDEHLTDDQYRNTPPSPVIAKGWSRDEHPLETDQRGTVFPFGSSVCSSSGDSLPQQLHQRSNSADAVQGYSSFVNSGEPYG
ncbi:unnamed protein product [Dicrocoelium dendriticum]|nr:unnamed protein product [Dicrocoelium dendriticum]